MMPISGWEQHIVPLFNGQYDTNINTRENYATYTLGEIWSAAPTKKPKSDAPAFIPSCYHDYNARTHKVQRECGAFVALTGDIDKGNVPLERVRHLTHTLFGDATAVFVHSTGSASEDNKRWRIIVPLDKPVSFDQWSLHQNAFFGFMEASGVPMDWALARPAQPVYLPNVPPDKRGEDGEPHYYAKYQAGKEGLTMTTLTPVFSDAVDALRADMQAKEAVRAAAARGPVRTFSGDGPIATYNGSHHIKALLTQYKYEVAPDGKNWRSPHQQSGSYATGVFVGEDSNEFWISLSDSDAAAGLGVQTVNGHRFGDAFDLFTHYEHGGDRAAALSAWNNTPTEVEAERRKEQREINKKIGSGSDIVPKTEICTLLEILERYAFIRDGSMVADLLFPERLLSLIDFKNAIAGSKHQVPGVDGRIRTIAVSKAWLEHSDRLEAYTLTFRGGAKRMTVSPQGLSALNLWRPRLPMELPENCEWLASQFVTHIRWLWGEHADAFLDWLAHIEQRPGELPHFGWIHISRAHGKGRNWISSALARVWRGNVAPSLDLIDVLTTGFNGRLSRCMLAIVDEINEGGAKGFHNAQTLRQRVTAEVHEINPKFGRRWVEYNAARWLLFSNHTGAIPLTKDDRRFWVVNHEGLPRDEAYYTHLYAQLDDPNFISSVAEFLRTRDISGFNPGQRPPNTAAKADLIALTQSADDDTLQELVSLWPVDVISASELRVRCYSLDALKQPAFRHAMDRAGVRKLRKVRIKSHDSYDTGLHPELLYTLRNHDQWSTRGAAELRAEIGRIPYPDKTKALETCDD